MNIIRAKCPALLFLLPAVSAIVNAQTVIGSASSCTNANLSGSYGYTLSGWILQSTGDLPFADGGSLTADGNGNLSGSSSYSLAGGIQGRTLKGTYSVNSDCTGTATLVDSLGTTTDLSLVVGGNGQSIQLVQKDGSTVISGRAVAQETSCTAETISGSYSFALSGWLFDTSGNEYPFTDTGKLSSSGNKNLTVNDTTSTAGTIQSRTSGTYSLNSNCTGTVALEDPNLGTANLNIVVVAGGIVFVESDAGTTISGSANVLADVITGGSMAHIAAGGGWQTTFTLINSGATSSQVQLDFFDNSGNALSLPLTYVQTGAKTTASSITQTIAAGATLVLLTQGSSIVTVTEGSAQLTSNGGASVSGFAIFAYNGQEAVVPLETRNPAAFVLGFDDTSGLATGVALANVSGTAAKVGVVLRDDTGAVLDTTAISLAARGHTAFVLSTNYESVKNKRGTVEFDTPPGGQITALGILATPNLVFTTIPVLVK